MHYTNNLLNGQKYSRLVLLNLYKDGEYRLVILGEILGEILGVSTIADTSRVIINCFRSYENEKEARAALSILTLDRNVTPQLLNVGKSISNREREMIVNRVCQSTVDLWIRPGVINGIYSIMCKKHAVS